MKYLIHIWLEMCGTCFQTLSETVYYTVNLNTFQNYSTAEFVQKKKIIKFQECKRAVSWQLCKHAKYTYNIL